jgi:fermentation-respiration switch protein FrsA (DUF1100 family)
MTHSEWLQTLAEIGIGFAGFSALIAGMRHRDEPISAENRARGRAVIETSFAVLFGAILPVILHGLGLGETSAFRLAATVLAIAGTPLTIRGYRRGMALQTPKPGQSPIIRWVGFPFGILSLGFAVACVVGLPQPIVPTYYLASLTGTLGIAALNFIGFVYAIDER